MNLESEKNIVSMLWVQYGCDAVQQKMNNIMWLEQSKEVRFANNSKLSQNPHPPFPLYKEKLELSLVT